MKLLLGSELSLNKLIIPKKLVVKFYKNFYIFEIVVNKPVKSFFKKVKISKKLIGNVITIVDKDIIKKIYAKGFIEVKEYSGAIKVFGEYVDFIGHKSFKIEKMSTIPHEAFHYIPPDFSSRNKAEFLKLKLYRDRFSSDSYLIGNKPHSSIEFNKGISYVIQGGEEINIPVEELGVFHKQNYNITELDLFGYKTEIGNKIFFVDKKFGEILYDTNTVGI